jgi:hypothetical protein
MDRIRCNSLPDFCLQDDEIIRGVGLWRGYKQVANSLQLALAQVLAGGNEVVLEGEATEDNLRARSRNQSLLRLRLRHLRSTHCNICCLCLLDNHM